MKWGRRESTCSNTMLVDIKCHAVSQLTHKNSSLVIALFRDTTQVVCLCIYNSGIYLELFIPGSKFWYFFLICSEEGVETKNARSSIWPPYNFLMIFIPSSSWQIVSLEVIKMYIVLLHFARDIIPSTVVAVLSASLAILEELKHKNKSNSSVIN